jgi:hypothetical protein
VRCSEYEKRILVPFDFDFQPVLKRIKEEKRNAKEVESRRLKERKRKQEQRAKKANVKEYIRGIRGRC